MAPVMALCGSSLQTRPVSVSKSAFSGTRLTVAPRARVASVNATRRTTVMRDTAGYKWLNGNPVVFAAGFLGWTVPAASPAPAFGGDSLFGLLLKSIGDNLSHFPVGPSLDDRFWLYLVLYHVGLFTVLTLGQIGYNGSKQGYFNVPK